MKLVSIDTNCVLDFFLKRANSKRLKQLILEAVEGDVALYISLIVVLEIEWVLRSYYGFTRNRIANVLKQLFELPNCEIPDKSRLAKALLLYENTSQVSLDDCVLVLESIDNKCADLATSDKKLLALYKKLRKN